MQALVEELENKIASLTEEMYAEGKDTATVTRLVKDKDAAEARSAQLYQEVKPTRLFWIVLSQRGSLPVKISREVQATWPMQFLFTFPFNLYLA